MHVPGRSGTTLHTPPHVEQYKHTGLPCMDKTRPISYWYWTKYKVMEGASGRGGGGGGGGRVSGHTADFLLLQQKNGNWSKLW